VEDIDDVVETMNARDARRMGRAGGSQPGGPEKVLVGRVEAFFDRLSVAAVALEGKLKIGDLIEIGTEDDAIRQRVTSMQIDRKDVLEAGPGDEVGIKTKYPVRKGSEVCRIG
jgi:hypothetical protein